MKSGIVFVWATPSFMNRRIEKLCHCCGDGPMTDEATGAPCPCPGFWGEAVDMAVGKWQLAIGGWQLAIMVPPDRESVVSFLSGPTDFVTSDFTERA
eukprot:scaffold305879_cov152-Cyclotella_meneghiniana.AAC.2